MNPIQPKLETAESRVSAAGSANLQSNAEGTNITEAAGITEAAEIDEVLVAYLDGELSPAETEAIDKRLASDSEYRHRLRELQQAWDMLDLVPRASVQEEFTRSTVEMVTLTAAGEVRRSSEARRRRRWLWQAAAALAIVVVGIGGYAFASYIIDRPNRQLLADLPLLVDLNLYSSAESTEFLSELERRSLIASDESESETSEQPSAEATAESIAPSALAELTLASTEATRRMALSTLPTAEIDALRRKKTKFDSLDAAEQERLRALHREISQSTSALAHRQTMERYNDWLKTISSSERAELRGLTGVARVDRVDQLLKAQQAERFQQLLEGGLAEEDLDKISAWIDAYIEEHESELLANLKPEFRRKLEESDESARRRLLALAVFRAGGPRPLHFSRPRIEQLAGLTESLSQEAKDVWEKTDKADRPQLAQRWITAAFWSKGPPVSEKQLRDFYKSLDVGERDSLDRLPADRMTAELRKMFYRRQFQREAQRDGRMLFPERREFPRGFPGELAPAGETPLKRKDARRSDDAND